MACFSIAIDGPAGAGKSTLARRLAQKIRFLYVDTGAIYRTVGLHALNHQKNPALPEDVIPLLSRLSIRMTYEADGLQHMYLQGEEVTAAIRENPVSKAASQVSAIPEVRSFLLDMQRDLARGNNVVMDGRDIGTVVLPDADLKIFLTASAETRAKRRHQELLEKGSDAPYRQILEEIRQRDAADSNRSVAPLRQAEDAVLLDTSALNLEQSLDALLTIVKENLSI